MRETHTFQRKYQEKPFEHISFAIIILIDISSCYE